MDGENENLSKQTSFNGRRSGGTGRRDHNRRGYHRTTRPPCRRPGREPLRSTQPLRRAKNERLQPVQSLQPLRCEKDEDEPLQPLRRQKSLKQWLPGSAPGARQSLRRQEDEDAQPVQSLRRLEDEDA
jgi:hypothetical protein